MASRQLNGTIVVIIEPELEAALEIQDRLVDDGALVFTAYRLERAEYLLTLPKVDGVVVRQSVLDANRKLKSHILKRKIPRIFYHGSKSSLEFLRN